MCQLIRHSSVADNSLFANYHQTAKGNYYQEKAPSTPPTGTPFFYCSSVGFLLFIVKSQSN